MIDGGWAYVWGAYALAIGGLTVLAVVIAVRAAYWAKRARELDKSKQ